MSDLHNDAATSRDVLDERTAGDVLWPVRGALAQRALSLLKRPGLAASC
ncbi:MAG TPA: hypothetical protein VHH52_07345 [Pseudonocardiaceae bacterium]|nr:hypothetical protein [Pseudonocardiaceae bacterium]